MRPKPQEVADLVTFTEEIFNRRHFLFVQVYKIILDSKFNMCETREYSDLRHFCHSVYLEVNVREAITYKMDYGN